MREVFAIISLDISISINYIIHMKPKIYESEGVLLNFIRKNTDEDLMRYIRSMYSYIDQLERKVDLEDMNNRNDEKEELTQEEFPDPLNIFFDGDL